jgi:hypothetical protein
VRPPPENDEARGQGGLHQDGALQGGANSTPLSPDGKPWQVICTRHDGKPVPYTKHRTRAEALATVARLIAWGMHAELVAPEGDQ